jgi:hypothetical protein
MRHLVLAWALVALVSVSPVNAQSARTPIDVHALGPQVGDRVPDFSLPDQTGTVRTLDSIMGPNGAMIVFHRSANW